MTETPSSVYVYGVLRASDPPPVSATGVTGAPVRTVEHDGLAALVGDLTEGTLMVAREVKAHWRVLEEASARTTVLPVRFGTVLEDDDAVRDRLFEPQADRLTAMLGHLAGRVQLSVKGDYDQAQLLHDVVRQSPAVAALRDRVRGLPDAAGYYDKIRLGELVAKEIARRRDQDTDLALERLAPLAVDARAEEVAGSDAAFNLAFLVERDAVDRFGDGVRDVADALGDRVHMRYLGPLPPYAFVDQDLTAGSAAWA